jgi:hypothetical protein
MKTRYDVFAEISLGSSVNDVAADDNIVSDVSAKDIILSHMKMNDTVLNKVA